MLYVLFEGRKAFAIHKENTGRLRLYMQLKHGQQGDKKETHRVVVG